jgi:septum site-determining protein MinD
MGKTFGIISIKGGVGKTSATVSLGSVLATEFNKNVLLVDANFSAPNLGLHLGLVDPPITIHHVLNNEVKINEAIYETDYGFHILPGSLIPNKDVDPLKLRQKIRSIKKNYDIILIDSSPSRDDDLFAAMMTSNELLVVTTPDYPTLGCTMHTVKLAKEKKIPISGLILNKIRDKEFELNIQEIEEETNSAVLATIPDEVEVLKALSETTPSTLYNKKSASSREYKKMAAALIGEKYEDTGIKAWINKFFRGPKRMPTQELNRQVLRYINKRDK